MKLVTFQIETPVGRFNRIGTLKQEEILDLTSAHTLMLAQKMPTERAAKMVEGLLPPSMLSLLGAGDRGFELADDCAG